MARRVDNAAQDDRVPRKRPTGGGVSMKTSTGLKIIIITICENDSLWKARFLLFIWQITDLSNLYISKRILHASYTVLHVAQCRSILRVQSTNNAVAAKR